MGRGKWIVVLALAGCDELAGIGSPGPAQTSCVIGGIDLCLNAEPQNPLTIDTDVTLDTSKDCSIVHFVPPQPSLCVLYATDVTINTRLFATGSRPLVIAASGTITINGTVDVSSLRGMPAGAASAGTQCVAVPDNNNAFGGGAGGSFIGKGGNGGAGYNNEPGDQASPAQPAPEFPRGGCPGSGGLDSIFTGGGGRGGGAVWLAAGTQILINGGGRVLALGGGGASGAQGQLGEGGGSGGGGSGGFIRLAAPTLAIEGVVAANGGGGGEGGEGGSNGKDGTMGEDGRPSIEPAKGGAGATNYGGDGGNGGAHATANGANATNATVSTTQAGGGGGGGGVGYIHFVADTINNTGGTISPAPL